MMAANATRSKAALAGIALALGLMAVPLQSSAQVSSPRYGTLELDFMSPEVGTASGPADRTPLWPTTDGGTTWTTVVIDAGPYVLQ